MFDALQDPAVPTSQFLAEFRERMNKLAACPNLSLTTYILKDLASAEMVYVRHDAVRGALQ